MLGSFVIFSSFTQWPCRLNPTGRTQRPRIALDFLPVPDHRHLNYSYSNSIRKGSKESRYGSFKTLRTFVTNRTMFTKGDQGSSSPCADSQPCPAPIPAPQHCGSVSETGDLLGTTESRDHHYCRGGLRPVGWFFTILLQDRTPVTGARLPTGNRKQTQTRSLRGDIRHLSGSARTERASPKVWY